MPCGPAAVGECRPGTSTCGSDGTWGPCLGAVEPREEDALGCNGKDDDCNGERDDFTPLTASDCLVCGEACPDDPNGEESCDYWEGCLVECHEGYTDCGDGGGCLTLDTEAHCGACFEACDTGELCGRSTYTAKPASWGGSYSFSPVGCCPDGRCWLGEGYCYEPGMGVIPEAYLDSRDNVIELMVCTFDGSWQPIPTAEVGTCPTSHCLADWIDPVACVAEGHCIRDGGYYSMCDAPGWTSTPNSSSCTEIE